MATPTTTKRKLVLKMSVSLDGFVAGPRGEVGWIFRTAGGGDSTEWALNTLREAGVHIMGRCRSPRTAPAVAALLRA